MTETTPILPVPLAIDYTSRDYESLRTDLIARVKQRVPQWSGTDASDFGVALVEAMAHMGDLLAYYTDRTASEAFIATAMRRESIIQHALALGYRPTGYRAATVEVLVTNSSASTLTIPKGTKLRADVTSELGTVTEIFENPAAVTFGPVGSPGTELIPAATQVVIFRHGETVYDELIGISTATPGQSFRLVDSPAVDSSTSIKVGSALWSEVLHITDSGPSDPVYIVDDDGAGNITVTFGDGVSGAIPTLYQNIRATYVVGGGVGGNIPVGSVKSLLSSPTLTANEILTLNSGLSFANSTAGAGGSDPESDDQIRWAAPQVGRAANRAVTLADHAALALDIPGVGAASAAATDPFNVTVYIAPYRTAGSAEVYPGGFHSDTFEMANLKTAVRDNIIDKVILGTSLQIVEPEYADVLIDLEVTCLPNYLQSEVSQNAMEALLATFGYVYMDFNQTIYREQIESVLNQVDGVLVARVNDLRHEHGAAGPDPDPTWPEPDGRTLPAIPDVIWIFKEDKVTMPTPTGGISG